MSRVEEIKTYLELWDNRYFLEPPESKHGEILQETVKQRAKIFEQQSPEHVRYLLSRLEIAEKALEEIAKYAPEDWVEKDALEALQQIREDGKSAEKDNYLGPQFREYYGENLAKKLNGK